MIPAAPPNANHVSFPLLEFQRRRWTATTRCGKLFPTPVGFSKSAGSLSSAGSSPASSPASCFLLFLALPQGLSSAFFFLLPGFSISSGLPLGMNPEPAPLDLRTAFRRVRKSRLNWGVGWSMTVVWVRGGGKRFWEIIYMVPVSASAANTPHRKCGCLYREPSLISAFSVNCQPQTQPSGKPTFKLLRYTDRKSKVPARI